MIVRINNKKINPIKSFKEKYGWNEILLIFLFNPRGLLDPVWCKKRRWIIVRAKIKKGNKKWSPKNRVRVGLLTVNSPQIHWTKSGPKYGIVDNRLVITIAPQNDICPQGKT